MAIEKADIVTRVAERLRIAEEGRPLSSQDRVTIENICDDVFGAIKNELRISWTLDDIPASSVMGFCVCVAALAASPVVAPSPETHEARWDFGFDTLRVINRLRPDNHVPVETEHY